MTTFIVICWITVSVVAAIILWRRNRGDPPPLEDTWW